MSSSRTSSSSTWSLIDGGHLQPHRRAEPAPGQLAFQRLQQVLVAVLVDLQLGVAGDPEQVVLDHLHAGEELAQVDGDELLDRQEAAPLAVVAARCTNRGTLFGTLTRANSSGCRRPGRAPTTARFSDRPEMYGNGCAGSTASGVRTGKTCSRKYVRSRSRSARSSSPQRDQLDALGGQLRPDLVGEAGGVPGDQVGGALGDHLELVAQRRAGRRRAPAGRPAAVASARPPGPCRTRRGCWRRWPGTWPAPAAACSGSSASASTRALKSSQDSSRLRKRSSGRDSSISGPGLGHGGDLLGGSFGLAESTSAETRARGRNRPSGPRRADRVGRWGHGRVGCPERGLHGSIITRFGPTGNEHGSDQLVDSRD